MHPFLYSCLFLLLLITQNSLAQNQSRTLGTWKSYLPYEQAQCLTQVGSKIVVGTQLSIFSYDLEDGSVQTYSKVDGFSDLDIVQIAYQESLDVIVILYANGVIDFWEDNKITTNTDIKRANIFGLEFYDVFLAGELLYISSSAGIIVLDIANKEIADTYKVGLEGEVNTVYQTTILEDKIYCATSIGLFEAAINNPNLSNFNNWTRLENLGTTGVEFVATIKGELYAAQNDMLYHYEEQTDWLPVHGEEGWLFKSLNTSQDRIIITEWKTSKALLEAADVRLTVFDGETITAIKNDMKRPLATLMDANGNIWIADFWRGLVTRNGANSGLVLPAGPYDNSVFNMVVSQNKLWVAPGGYKSDLDYFFSRSGFFTLEEGEWSVSRNQNVPLFAEKDITDVSYILPVSNSDVVYMASYGVGLLEYDGTNFTLYNHENSSLGEAEGDAEGRVRVAGLALDNDRNLWMSNPLTDKPISVKTPEGEFYAFDPSVSLQGNALIEMVIDRIGQKWMIAKAQGILVFNHGTDLESTADDYYKLLTPADGLPSENVTCLTRDLEGRIWVGTRTGGTVFYCPEQVFTPNGCTASKFNIGGQSLFLLRDSYITDIAIDGANRKWVGTTTGLWLLSEDGEETLNYFNVDNSPLVSNVITALAVNYITGEIFIGTDRGIVSYQGAALGALNTHGEVLVYPNPVRPEYQGDIGIKGLANNAHVKITDIAGNLVYETRALGGQAVWDGKDYNGRRAATGVYLIFTINETGDDTNVAKLLFVK